MSTTTHFPTYGAAMRYYRPHFTETPAFPREEQQTNTAKCRLWIDHKLNVGDIRIGPPELTPGQGLTIKDNRYFITILAKTTHAP